MCKYYMYRVNLSQGMINGITSLRTPSRVTTLYLLVMVASRYTPTVGDEVQLILSWFM